MIRAALAAAFLFLPAAAFAQARERATVIMPENAAARAFQEQVGYSDAVVIDGTIYLSGVIAALGQGGDTLEAAYERAFKRIENTLRRAGASWADVVDLTTFHTDIKAQVVPIVTVKSRYVKAPYPTWTAIQVSRLYEDRGVTEIKLVARLPKAK